MDYQRVIWPGFAWSNWHSGSARNKYPRLGGEFIWSQARLAVEKAKPTIGAKTPCSMYIAMFDEFDEGTAIAKAAPDKSYIPKA